MVTFKMISQLIITLFGKNLENVEYNDTLTITVAIKWTSQKKFFKELGLYCIKPLCMFFKIKSTCPLT